jgi:pyruvate, water dikinase
VTVLTLAQAAAADVAEVGGKARGLSRLVSLGLPVPAALVLPAAVYDRWLHHGSFSEDEARELWASAASLGDRLAVRSSAADEDDAERSAAGQYESVMDVRDPDALRAAIERCFRAADGLRARAYRHDAPAARLALVVQRSIRADRSGVAFSADPVTKAHGSIVIEAVFGHGEGLVSGELAPDRYRVDRASGIVLARVADKPLMADGRGELSPVVPERRFARVLRDHDARAVAELVARAEDGFGMAVDVEFCMTGETLWLLQCRPITTLSGSAGGVG